MKQGKGGFSVIEVMIGMFVFTLGLISIYSMLVASLRVDASNKNGAIALNLAREQLEMVKNIRDSNYESLRKWSYISESASSEFSENKAYVLHYSPSGKPYLDEKTFPLDEENITQISDFRVCIEDESYYVACDGSPNQEETHFYKYTYFQESSESGVFEVVSRVVWYQRGFHDFELKTLIADWRRI